MPGVSLLSPAFKVSVLVVQCDRETRFLTSQEHRDSVLNPLTSNGPVQQALARPDHLRGIKINQSERGGAVLTRITSLSAVRLPFFKSKSYS